MGKYAKWIGGGLGWFFGGPLGALLGFAVGSMFDGPRQNMTTTNSTKTFPNISVKVGPPNRKKTVSVCR